MDVVSTPLLSFVLNPHLTRIVHFPILQTLKQLVEIVLVIEL